MENIAKAITACIQEIKGVEKNTTVGAGNSSYKAVGDKDVKLSVRNVMAKNGLSLLPVKIDHTTQVLTTVKPGYNGGPATETQKYFTEVRPTYMLLHTSGESIELQSLGQGMDAQDKGPGKAMTYAMKYLLLYVFLIPTGDIDDSDTEASEDVIVKRNTGPVITIPNKIAKATSKEQLTNIWQSLTPDEQNENKTLFAERKKQLNIK